MIDDMLVPQSRPTTSVFLALTGASVVVPCAGALSSGRLAVFMGSIAFVDTTVVDADSWLDGNCELREGKRRLRGPAADALGLGQGVQHVRDVVDRDVPAYEDFPSGRGRALARSAGRRALAQVPDDHPALDGGHGHLFPHPLEHRLEVLLA